MRTREEIEKDIKDDDLKYSIGDFILEVLLDIRDQNEKDRMILDNRNRGYIIRIKK